MFSLAKGKQLLKRFQKNDDGNMTLTFAVSAVMLIGAMGAAMDYSTLSNASSRSQSIADQTALAAAIYVKNNDSPPQTLNQGFTPGTHTAHSLGYEFKGFIEGGANNVEINVVYDDDAKETRVTVSGKTVPTFIQLLGKQDLTFSSVSVASYLEVDETHPASIALVLDNSGSMSWDSQLLEPGRRRPAGAESRLKGLQSSVTIFRDELEGRLGSLSFSAGHRILRTGILPYNSELIEREDEQARRMDWRYAGLSDGFINEMKAGGNTNSNPPMLEARRLLELEDDTHRDEAKRVEEEYRQPLKFVVFMTDGQNTTGDYEVIPGDTGRYYGQIDGRGDRWFVTTRSSTASFYGFTEGTLTLATDRQTIESCDAMKAEGTTIYTIGYALEVGEYYNPSSPSNPATVSIATRDTANSLLAACASQPEFFISAGTGDELESAFDQIQNSIIKELIRLKS